jgi:8-oxo-dGTP pyrophosphatase MutT (NUDIX family)
VSSSFERIATENAYEGRIVTVRNDRFRYEDGEEAEREIIGHPGAVGVVVHDDEVIYLVRQPREPIGVPDLLEVPAGKLDEDGESPLDTGKRELVEEIGKQAAHWEHLKTYWSSPGISDEEIHLYLATELTDVDAPETEEDERIEIVRWPLADLDGLIDECVDGKTLVGLLELRRRRA